MLASLGRSPNPRGATVSLGPAQGSKGPGIKHLMLRNITKQSFNFLKKLLPLLDILSSKLPGHTSHHLTSRRSPLRPLWSGATPSWFHLGEFCPVISPARDTALLPHLPPGSLRACPFIILQILVQMPPPQGDIPGHPISRSSMLHPLLLRSECYHSSWKLSLL